MHKRYLTTLAMAAIALSPLFVMQAASLTDLSQNYRLPVDTDINVDLNADLETDADATVDDSEDDGNSSGADANVNANANAGASITGEMMRVTRDDLRSEADMGSAADFRSRTNRGGISADMGGNATGSVNAIENASDRAFEVASENSILLRADGVSTEADLRAFALVAMEDDESIDSMSFESDRVEVSYKGNGRFIGLIPVVMDVDVEVDQEGEVEFDYPWYGFLIDKDKTDLEALIEAEVEAALATEASDGWTNYDRARLAASIITALKAHYESTTATTTDAEV